ncbi:MAG TPA: TonB-dependent receptor [Thermoanaerobaculaceae bacterium]|nr:TonB-dependent receptor [Thermoanaerobaculaceae bacterium]HRS16251.1 TonB-dependent receptor [Thermoanaerobaculaceae bacterium]
MEPLIAALVIAIAAHAPAEPASAQAAAQEGETPGADAPRLKEELVVTASRYEQATFATAVPIDVVSAEHLERARPEKIMDMLKQLPGIEVAGEGPFRGLPVIRGLSSNRVLVLVDGQRLNNSRESTQFAGIQPGLVDLSQVERIEVVRGPASVQYGSDALGGVINIITRQQAFSSTGFRLSGGVDYEFGSAAKSHRGKATLGGAGKRVTFHLGTSYFEANDYESPRGIVPNSGMTQKSAEGNVRVQVGQQAVLKADLQVTRTIDVGFPGYDPQTSGIDISFPRFDRDKVGLTFDSGPMWGLGTITLAAYAQNVVKESKLDIGPRKSLTTSEIDSRGGSAQATAALGTHLVVFGLDYYRDDLHDRALTRTTTGTSTNVQVPDSTQEGLGLYVQDEVSLSDRLKLVVGARGDRFTFVSHQDPRYLGAPFDESASALSGSLAARYEATPNVALNASVGRAFRAPNLQERAYFGFVSGNLAYIEQNPDLDPETSLNAELGFKVRYDRYSGGFTAYRNSVKDFIAFSYTGRTIPNPRPGQPPIDVARFENVSNARIEGAELDLQAGLSARWTAFGSVAYARGTDERTDEPLPLIAPLKGRLGVRYEQSRFWGEVAARLVARNDRVAPGYEKTPGFAVYDLRLGYRLEAGLVLQAAVENFTDKAYAEPFNLRLEPGRNLRASIGYRF